MLNNQGQASSVLMKFIIKRGISWRITQTQVKLQWQQVLQEERLRTYNGGWGRLWLSWRMSGTYCRKEKGGWGLRGEGYHFAPIFERLRELLVSCYMKSSFSSQSSRRLASWAAFITCRSPSQPCAPAKLYCTALPCFCAFPHALPGNCNVNFGDWLLVQTSCSLRLCSKSTLSLRFCCSPQPIHLSSSVSESCSYFSPGACYSAFMHTPDLPKQLDGKILASVLQLTRPTVPFLAQGAQLKEQINDTQICGQIALRVTLGMISLWSMKMAYRHGGSGNTKASFGNRLLGFKSQLHNILSVLPRWASCLISLCLSFFICKMG